MFSCQFYVISKNNFSYRTPSVTASALSINFNESIFQHLIFLTSFLIHFPYSSSNAVSSNKLNPNHGLNYIDNLHLFSISPSSRIQGLGVRITALCNHQIWYLFIETPLTLRPRKTYIYIFRALFGFCNFEATSCGFWKLGVSSFSSTLNFE